MLISSSCPIVFYIFILLGGGDPVWAQNSGTVTNGQEPKESAATDLETFKQLSQQAEQARDNGNLAVAIQLYSRLVKMRPEWAEGWWYVGSLNYDLDQYADAAAAFERLLNQDSQNCQAWGFLGLCEYQLGRNAKALEHLTKSRQLGLDRYREISRVVRLHQAMLLNRSQQFEAALSVLHTFALERKEANTVLDAMGMAVLRISDPLDTLSPEQREMIRRFGQAAYLEGEQRREESFNLFRELEARYRGKPNVAYAFGAALLVHQEPEKAIGFFKLELERDPNHEAALLQLALQMIGSGKFVDGIPYARKAIEVAPGNFAGYFTLGRIYLYLNNLPKSIVLLEKAVSIAPMLGTLHYTLSQAYQRAHRPDDAAHARAQFLMLEALNKKQPGNLPLPPGTPASAESSRQGQQKE